MSNSQIKQAVILAGGRGTRLGTVTAQTPKPMISINNAPFLGYLLQQLSFQGIEKVVVLVGYLGDQIKKFCGDGREWGMQITCVESPIESETGWRLRDARHLLDPLFLLMYCDNYWPMDLVDMTKAFIFD